LGQRFASAAYNSWMLALLRSIFVLATLAAIVTLGMAAPAAQATTSGTGISARGNWTPPTGPAPRLPNGRPDFSGVWDHQYVPDMTATNQRNPAMQKGPKELPYTPAGVENMKQYNPERDGDYTGMCMPYGLTRSMNAPYPIQIFQNDKYIAFLFEVSTWFHVVPFRTEHPKELDPTWFGNSIAKWDGDTLVVDTIGFNGFTRLDTVGHPHSDRLHVVQTFKHVDAGHIAYKVTIEDPTYYSEPWTNERVMTLSNGELLEYSCEENNKSLWEGRIKLWIPPNSSQPRSTPSFPDKK
jgi:hypothetical protein